MPNVGAYTLIGDAAIVTAGTPVPLETTSYPLLRSITIRAKSGNTGSIWIGGSTIDTTISSGLGGGEGIEFVSPTGIDVSLIYIDGGTATDGVDYYGTFL